MGELVYTKNAGSHTSVLRKARAFREAGTSAGAGIEPTRDEAKLAARYQELLHLKQWIEERHDGSNSTPSPDVNVALVGYDTNGAECYRKQLHDVGELTRFELPCIEGLRTVRVETTIAGVGSTGIRSTSGQGKP